MEMMDMPTEMFQCGFDELPMDNDDFVSLVMGALKDFTLPDEDSQTTEQQNDQCSTLTLGEAMGSETTSFDSSFWDILHSITELESQVADIQSLRPVENYQVTSEKINQQFSPLELQIVGDQNNYSNSYSSWDFSTILGNKPEQQVPEIHNFPQTEEIHQGNFSEHNQYQFESEMKTTNEPCSHNDFWDFFYTNKEFQDFHKVPVSQELTLQKEQKTTVQLNGQERTSSGEEIYFSGNVSPTNDHFTKPSYSFTCLIALALKNSKNGWLPVPDIYWFISHHFPYYKTASPNWKNSVRHSLTFSKYFEKIVGDSGCKRYLQRGFGWTVKADMVNKMDSELLETTNKYEILIKKSMAQPDILGLLLEGSVKIEPVRKKSSHRSSYKPYNLPHPTCI